jgi:hypothetical protein
METEKQFLFIFIKILNIKKGNKRLLNKKRETILIDKIKKLNIEGISPPVASLSKMVLLLSLLFSLLLL